MEPKKQKKNGIKKLRSSSHERKISDSIINHSRSMISVINRDYIYEKVNLAFCSAHNLSKEKVVGKSLSDLWGTETFCNFIKHNIDRCFEGETIRYEASFETPGYGARYFEVTFRPLSIEGDSITHLLAETFDIHEVKQKEQELSKKEEELKKLETNLPIGIVRCLPDGSILHTNRAFLNIMECVDESYILKANFRSFYPQDYLFDIHCEQLLEKHIVNFGRISLHDCHGKEISCRISGFIAFDSNNAKSYLDFVV